MTKSLKFHSNGIQQNSTYSLIIYLGTVMRLQVISERVVSIVVIVIIITQNIFYVRLIFLEFESMFRVIRKSIRKGYGLEWDKPTKKWNYWQNPFNRGVILYWSDDRKYNTFTDFSKMDLNKNVTLHLDLA